ncbi:MAG TPA: hypothetical protein VNN77_10245 [candidate division Zixibacteria bacterium]|nr:hypothetical protein [candidate division Zixibacteria bacterium]
MKKPAVVAMTAAFLGLLVLGGQVMAAPSIHLSWGSQVNPGQCDGASGKLVINVTHQVTGDIDSGVGGNYWAYDDYNKHIQVWQTDTNTFCADVRYLGSFVTVAGRSPQNTDTIAAGIEGTFEGGYRAIIIGTLDPDPLYRTRGSIGKFDYGCDAVTGNCVNLFSWPDTYFASYSSFNLDWWGWVYQGGSNGTWVNSIDGNQGDITD